MMSLSLQETALRLLTAHEKQFSAIWPAACAVSLGVLFVSAAADAVARGKWQRWSRAAFPIACFLVFSMCRLPAFAYGEANPDEGQWLASAVDMNASLSEYLGTFYSFDFTRVLTIAPLWLASKLGLAIDYGLAKLVWLACWSLTALSFFLAVKDVFDRRAAALATALLVAFVAPFSFFDYAAYNSEVACITVVSLFLFVTFRSLSRDTPLYPVLSGLLACAIPFAKEQALYLAVSLAACAAVLHLTRRRRKHALWLAGGGLLGVVLFALPIIISGSYRQCYETVVLSLSYSKRGLSTGGIPLFDKLRHLFAISRPFFVAPPLLLGVALALRRWRRPAGDDRSLRAELVLIGVLYAACVYTIVMPADFFSHYTLFFLLPSVYVLAAACYWARRLAVAVAVGLVLYLPVAVVGWRGLTADWQARAKNLAPLSSPFSQELTRHAAPGSRMLLWGWDCRYFIETKLRRGSRFWYPAFVTPSYSEAVRRAVTSQYEADLKTYRPTLVVELTDGGGRVAYAHQPLDSFPSLMDIIRRDYQLAYEGPAKRIYRLRLAQ